MIRIDGSHGEGGGQILRTALALSLATGHPFRIDKIRAGRRKPGLMRQHLAAVLAAAEVGNARVEGHAIASRNLSFTPRTLRSGRFHFAVGSAGSCTLVLQAILPALATAAGPTEIILEGGTHNPFAPPYEFLAQTFLPLVGRMGPRVAAVLQKPGFFPAGGGRLHITIAPSRRLAPLVLTERGAIRQVTARAVVSNLPLHIARRELHVVGRGLELPPDRLQAESVTNAQGPGNVLTITIACDMLTEVVTGFGQKGLSAEKVAARTVARARDYLALGEPVGPFLADQLLVPMALAGYGRFRTGPLSRHARTNIDIIRLFMATAFDIRPRPSGPCEIEIRGAEVRTGGAED